MPALPPRKETDMQPLATAAQMKEMDRIAICERGIASTVLMERAARALTDEILALPIPRKAGKRAMKSLVLPKGEPAPSEEEQQAYLSGQQRSAVVFCGPGNNGGDGVACACFLLEAGWRVKCVLVGKREKMTADSLEMERRLNQAGGTLEDFHPEDWFEYSGFDVAVDALFGVGLNSGLRPDAAEAVHLMKHAQWVVSADVPSGIHADTGEVLGTAVKADVTVTFSLGKPGLYVGKGAVHSGRVVVADIGIPQDLLSGFDCQTYVMEPPAFPRRKRDAHKGDFGRLFLLAGSREYTGAPALCANAAARSGAGLVTLAVPPEIWPIAAAKCCNETMVWPLPDNYDMILKKASSCDAAVIGPGLGQGERAGELVLSLLRDLKCPVILDADGLNIAAKHIDILDKREGLTVLTPHDGEFARLSGCELPIADRLSAARDFAAEHHCAVVLKGHRTITAAWNRPCVINTTGNPGMARGGSGDALAGIIGAMICQFDRGDVLAEAVWLHGRAGDLAAADKGEYGMTVTDLIGQIPYAMKQQTEGE